MLAMKIFKALSVFILLLITSGGALAAFPANLGGLEAYYSFEESAGQLVNVFNETHSNATIVGANYQADGILNYGLELDGGTDYIEVVNPSTNFVNTTTFTISLWFNMSAASSLFCFFDNTESGHTDGVQMCASTGTITYWVRNPTDHAMLVGASDTFDDDVMHHLVMTYDGTTIYGYIDNVLDIGTNYPDTLSSLTISEQHHIFSNVAETGAALGVVDEVSIWSRVLSGTERGELYGAGVAPTPPFPAAPPASNNTNVVFNNQTPADLTNTNLMQQDFNLTYTFNRTDIDTAFFNFSILTGLSCVQDVNGTCIKTNNSYLTVSANEAVSAAAGYINYSFTISENEAYPYRVNIIPSLAASYTNITLTSQAQYLADTILSIPTSQYNIYEAPVRTTGIIRIYYFNSSYDFASSPATSEFTTEIYNNQSLDGYNHKHFYTGHNPIPYSVVGGKIGTVDVDGGGFMIRGNAQGVIVTTDDRQTRSDATQLSATNGNTWNNQAYTVASHIHTFNVGDNIYYNAFMNISDGTTYNTTWKTDTYEIDEYPPTPPNIITPANDVVVNQYVAINYTAGTVNTVGAAMDNYIIEVYNDSLVKVATVVNNSLNLNYTFNAYTSGLPKAYYYIFVTGYDDNGLNSNDFERFYLNYTTPNLNVTQAVFTNGEGLNVSSNSTINYTCSNTLSNNFSMYVTFNGNVLKSGDGVSGTSYTNNTVLIFGDNTLIVNCSDHLGSVQETYTNYIYTMEMCLIDESDRTFFDVQNLTRTRVYFDDNSSYYDFKLNNVSCVNYTSAYENKLRFDLGYIGGTTITRYIDTTLIESPARICANKEGTTYYEQLIVSVSLTPVVMTSVYANCLIAADYTRFAYQDAYLLKAYSIETLYYLYRIDDGLETFLASIDGSIESYVNIDNLEFRQSAVDINILTDALSFSQLSANITEIYYINLRQDNTIAEINITRLDTNTLVYSNAAYSNPNEITIVFDYSSLTGINQSTIFRIDGFFTNSDGTTHTIKKYFNTAGQSAFLSSGVGFFISLLLVIFGLTFASTRITFSWFGLVICLAAIGVLTFSLSTWYNNFLLVLEVIVSIYIVITMTMQHGRTIAGVS